MQCIAWKAIFYLKRQPINVTTLETFLCSRIRHPGIFRNKQFTVLPYDEIFIILTFRYKGLNGSLVNQVNSF